MHRRASATLLAALAIAGCSSARPLSRTTTPSSTGSTASVTSTTAPYDTTTSFDPTPSSTTTVAPTTTTIDCTTVNHTTQTGIDYGPSSLDLYPTPQGCGTPVVVYVHGGGYCCGDKSQLITGTIGWFHAQGYAVASVDYSLNARYPRFDDDVVAAIAWLRANGGRFGIDGNRIALLGHSTGAEMVAEIGTNPALLASASLPLSALRCVGALDGGAFDLVRFNGMNATMHRAYTNAYGFTIAAWRAASAVTYVSRGDGIPPFLVVVRGTGSGALRFDVQQEFVHALQNAGVPTTVIDSTAITHAQVVSNIGRTGDRVMTAPLAAFLHSCLQ